MLESEGESEYSINDLPDEVLEYILSHVSPYKDLHECMQVSKRWRKCVSNVVRMKKRNLGKSISDFDIQWQTISHQVTPPGITRRYSHAAVISGNSMYVFGGCTCSMTTFNDLWKLDLSTRKWVRPLITGSYPSPKACSSLAVYKDKLVLFGGWTYPPTYPLYQTWHLFNELHVYDMSLQCWVCVHTGNAPPGIAGHSVSVISDWMILFGGLYKPDNAVHCEKSNDVWRLNLCSWTWEKMNVAGESKPMGRIGLIQAVLDEQHILVMGGSGGLNTSYHDVWILDMSCEQWTWREVRVTGERYRPQDIWSNPGCKFGDKIVVLNKVREPDSPSIVYYPKHTWMQRGDPEDRKLARIDLASRKPDTDENVNGKRGVLRNHKRQAEEDGGSGKESENDNTINQRVIDDPTGPPSLVLASFQTAHLPGQRVGTGSIRASAGGGAGRSTPQPPCKRRQGSTRRRRRRMGIHVLDISGVLQGLPVRWLAPKACPRGGPEETVLYSLLEGNAELVMFGGIQQEAGCTDIADISNQISNEVFFMTGKESVI